MINIWFLSLSSVILISLCSLIGAICLILGIKKIENILFFLISFSAGGLLGDVFLHLIPEMMDDWNLLTSLSIICGILIFFVLEKFVQWRHCHVPTSVSHPHPLILMNLVGDGLHNFIDGAIIAGSFLTSIPLGIATTVAVIFHEIPQEIGDFGVLLHGGFTKNRALVFNLISGSVAICGAIFILILGQNLINITQLLIPLTAGGFIYIAGSDLIPELHKETKPTKSLVQFLGIILGVGVMYLLKIID